MERNILTWTKLCQRAKYIREHRPEDYAALTQSGTTRFLTGYHVRLQGSSRFDVSTVSNENAARTLVTYVGIRTKSGVIYTKIKPNLTPTSYKKRFWEQYMPVSFPTGLPRRGASARVLFCSSGGTVGGIVSLSNYRSESARFSLQCGSPGHLLIRDDGERLVELHGSTGKIDDPQGLIESYEVDGYSCDFEPWSSATVEDTVGLRSEPTVNRDVWLAGILEVCNQGLMDKHIVLPLAARMWNAAYSFCQEHADKRPTFYATPMRKARPADAMWHASPCPALKWEDCIVIDTPHGQQVLPRNKASLDRYILPSICIEFQGGLEHDDGTHPYFYRDTMQSPRRIVMTLPPFGNELLEERPEFSVPGTRLHESWADMRGEYTNQHGMTPQPIQMCPEHASRYIERAYHMLAIAKPDGDERTIIKATVPHRSWHCPNTTWAEHDASDSKSWDKWSDRPGCVHVVSNFDERCLERASSGPWSTLTENRIGFAMTPEAAVNIVSEHWLLDSLPLS